MKLVQIIRKRSERRVAIVDGSQLRVLDAADIYSLAMQAA